MNGLIRFSLRNPRAVTVLTMTILLVGAVALAAIPSDILPVYRSPAVQALTFYNGMAATNVESSITARMERGTGQAAGMIRQESRSLLGVSIIRNFFADDIDPSGALTQVNSLATTEIPTLPPGTLPPVILPYDPTSSTPVCLVALNSKTQGESVLYDTARYQVRMMIMASRGANAPVVYGGKIRTILAYLDRDRLQAHGLAPTDVMHALDRFNVFIPAGGARFGKFEYTLESNAMYDSVARMADLPIKTDAAGRTVLLKEVADIKDAAAIQTNIVRVDGRRQVYIPVYRQSGYSTLAVVDTLRNNLPDMKERLTTPDVDLKLVMDQSVYVRKAIESLVEEGILGAVLCSLVILVFLGEWRMTLIASLTIPVAVFGTIGGLYGVGQSINLMTLAGLALAIGPLVDSAIVVLENTHRHLGLGAHPEEAAFLGAKEVGMPALAASLCTLLVLLPLTLMPGLGAFLFRPLFLAVAFAMGIAFVLSQMFVPPRCAAWLRGHGHKPIESHTFDYEHKNDHENAPPKGPLGRLFEKWENAIDYAIGGYTRLLALAVGARGLVIGGAFAALAGVVIVFGPDLRREFFPEVDAGAFEIFVRAPTGTRVEETEARVAEVEQFVKDRLGGDLELVISETGLTANWSAAYTPNAGPMDAVIKVQLKPERAQSAQECVHTLRQGFAADSRFGDLEFAFDAGGMIRSAMNEGKSSPLNVRITAKNMKKARKVAEQIMADVKWLDGVVDARIIQRLNYPQYVLEIDQAKAAALGLNQADVMQNVVAAFNSSVQFNKRNFWIDPKSSNQYYVGVQYPEADIASIETLLDIPITGLGQKRPIPLRNLVKVPLPRVEVPAEINHTNLQATMDLTMGVHGRDLGHVADDVTRVVAKYGKERPDGGWAAFDPETAPGTVMEGARIVLAGEYQKMQDTFRFQAFGMVGAVLLVYFLMVALFRSYLTPLVVLSAVPVGVVGVVLVLYFTGTALTVQSLLGVIFMIGIVVSNTVLLIDFAENVRKTDRLSPTAAILRAAAVRVRPVVMTALATFFALLPMSLGLSRGSEANVPLGRAVLGGLIAGLLTTLFVVPCIYSLLVPNKFEKELRPLPGEPGWEPSGSQPRGGAEGAPGTQPA
ncbi:MAG: efflux RND transporter permease subunit [Gemmataceae bacterium]|nr:efflux RND transporter permease subunit [Gemmataceae bacterium]